ncbi:D-hexose-6-phosphate mutarotase [Pseudomonas borbori]
MAVSTVDRIQRDDLTCWHIRRGDAELLITEQGAQVLSYRCGEQPPLIWLSEQAAYQHGQSVRGGIPVCWPWFGELQRNPLAVQSMHQQPANAPFHGSVRSVDWQLLGIDNQSEYVELRFAYNSSERPIISWPHAAELTLSVRLDDQLHLTLSTRNVDDTPLVFSQALHSYFAVSDIRQVVVEELQGCRYIDTLEDWQPRQQPDALGFAGETDRIYLDVPAQVSILDPAWQRRIVLRSSGSHSAIVWNPWIDKAQRLSQFADDAWQDMLCIEHATVMDDIVTLAPSEQYDLAISIGTQTV